MSAYKAENQIGASYLVTWIELGSWTTAAAAAADGVVMTSC